VSPWAPRTCRQCASRPVLSCRAQRCWPCTYPGVPPPPCKRCGGIESFTAGYCRTCHPRTVVARSCASCWAWGVYDGRVCNACNSFNFLYPLGECQSCHRHVVVHDGYCRLCRCQARLQARRGGHAPTLDGVAQRGLQLFLGGLVRSVRARRHLDGTDGASAPAPLALPSPARHLQPALVHVPPDFARLDADVGRRGGPTCDGHLQAVLASARSIAEARGWALETTQKVCRALRVLLATHPPGMAIPASTVQALARADLAVERTSEVLHELGLLQADLPASLDGWLAQLLHLLGARMRHEVSVWVDHLRHGDQRTRPRAPDTLRSYVHAVAPLLAAWSGTHQSLREITHQDVTLAAEALRGSRRDTTLVALRSLFGLLKKRRLVFTDPTTRLRVSRVASTFVPLDQQAIDQAVQAAQAPPARLVLVLAAVQALGTAQMRQLLLGDVDLGQRRLRVGALDRPLDGVTRLALERYLAYRQQRWPNTANPHLLITQQTAHGTGPASAWFFKRMFQGQPVSIKRLRQDRLLEELGAVGPDPLHIAAVFGVHATTATRYADAVRSRLDQATQTPATRPART
jgi:hypothetical protein